VDAELNRRGAGWWFPTIALGRVAALRVLAYAFVLLDVWLLSGWTFQHQDVAGPLYQPLWLARTLHLPEPTAALVTGLRAVLVGSALVALVATFTGATRVVRTAGAAAALTYLWWITVAMSYGKVDHDRFAYVVLLAVLPTVGVARLGERVSSAAAGWAMRMTQVAVIATYFLAAWAKVRIGGWGWVNGATLSWAVVRRGTWVSNWALDVPVVLRAFQWFIVVFELSTPLLFFVRRERVLYALVAGLYAFHLVSFAGIGIIFLPHLIALIAFLPLERVWSRRVSTVQAMPGSPPSRLGTAASNAAV